MIMLWLIILGYAFVALIDLLPLIRRRKWNAVAAFVFVYIAGLGLGICAALRIQVPSVIKGLAALFEKLGLSYPP